MLTKSIIWDIDGTVIDTRNAMASAYRVACEKMGLKEDNYRRIFAYVGQKSSKVFVDQFGLAGAAYDEAIDRYNRAFLTQGVHDADLYPGMRALLADLKQAGCQMTVATARSNRSLFPLFEANGLMDTFDYIACTYDSKTKVDKTALVRDCISFMKTPAEQCVMIGDRIFDIEGGKQNHTMTIGVTFGFAEEKEVLSSGADFIAHSVEELRQILWGRQK